MLREAAIVASVLAKVKVHRIKRETRLLEERHGLVTAGV
jgi:hypothetical protein